MNSALTGVSNRIEEYHSLMLSEIANVKRRHGRLLSLYSAGLEGGATAFEGTKSVGSNKEDQKRKQKLEETADSLQMGDLDLHPSQHPQFHYQKGQPLAQLHHHSSPSRVTSENDVPALSELIQLNEGLKSRFEQLKERNSFQGSGLQMATF